MSVLGALLFMIKKRFFFIENTRWILRLEKMEVNPSCLNYLSRRIKAETLPQDASFCIFGSKRRANSALSAFNWPELCCIFRALTFQGK